MLSNMFTPPLAGAGVAMLAEEEVKIALSVSKAGFPTSKLSILVLVPHSKEKIQLVDRWLKSIYFCKLLEVDSFRWDPKRIRWDPKRINNRNNMVYILRYCI